MISEMQMKEYVCSAFRKHFRTVSNHTSLVGMPYKKFFASSLIKARAVSVFSTQSQACSMWDLDFVRRKQCLVWEP